MRAVSIVHSMCVCVIRSSLGVYFVILTGARSSTTLSRLTGLPAPDAVVCESGGRLFLPATTTHGFECTPLPAPLATLLSEDWAWRKAIAPPSLVGSYTASARGVPPEKRGGRDRKKEDAITIRGLNR